MLDLVIPFVLTAAAGYLLGSINCALLVSRFLEHDDIRTHGSGNAGAANMFRTYGKKAALTTALGDALKAVAACLLARFIFNLFTVDPGFDPAYIAGFFVLTGHIFPVFFKFRGGKGVMPALGIVLTVNPLAFAVMVILAIPVFLLSRTISLVSIVSAALLPIITLILCLLRNQNPLYSTVSTILYAILVIFSHRDNIQRLRKGEEKPLTVKHRH